MPIDKVKVGKIQIAMWRNERTNKKGENFETISATVEKQIKKDDKWKSTNSYNVQDLFSLSLAVTEALRRIKFSGY